jgi:hypothetical protein
MIDGLQIEEARKLLGWTRATLSRKAGNLMTPNAVRKAEGGDDYALSREQLLAIESALRRAGVEFTAGRMPVLNSRLPRSAKKLRSITCWASSFAAKGSLHLETWEPLLVI